MDTRCFIIAVLALALPGRSAAEVVYRCLNWVGPDLVHETIPPAPTELGDQLTLAGTSRLVTNVRIGISNVRFGQFTAPILTLNLYANDGPPGTFGPKPGTLLAA